ncbi:SPFH/Band 7/PHB domain protein [archaeon]|nr:SPFH/Band 7/PHB domain protein [archaeon]
MAIIEIVVVMLVLALVWSGIRIVRPVEQGHIERLGKYKCSAEEGFHWIIPIVERMIKVNITENMVDIEPQKIITKDDLNADVDAVVYYKVKDSYKAIYKADDYRSQIVSLARTTLRDVIGQMTLSSANSERIKLNKKLETELDKHTNTWGIDIIHVELQRIEPPADVQESMNKVVKAEKDMVSAKDFATATETKADGEKRADIKRAEGIKQSAILEAEGTAKAIREIAHAEAEKIKVVNQSIQTNFRNEAQLFKKLETTERSLMNSSKIVLDPHSSITNVISDMSGVVPLPKSKPKSRQYLDQDKKK